MTETLSVPLNKLSVWTGNVRKTGAGEGIDELAASIEAHGLLQALIVRKAKGGKYAVVAGQRRLKALQFLASQDRLPGDAPVRCELVAADADGGELSLAENVVRVAMHPADQFEAFRDLVDRGLDVAAIARRFGVADTVVAKRLKLGRLSPIVLDAYRNGDIDLEAAQAFAITDDHAAQERVLNDLPEWNRSARLIRSHLTEDEIPATNKRVRFVGLAAYEEAGGSVRRDLFDDKHSGTIVDTALIDRLVAEKLAAVADSVRAEGWSWVIVEPSMDRSSLAEYRRAVPDAKPLIPEQQAEIESLTAEYDTLADSSEADDGDDAVLDRLDAIQQRLDEIENGQQVWGDHVLSAAGAMIGIGWDGIVIERGLLRDDASIESEADANEEPVVPVPAGLSAALVTDLTARRTAALQVAAAGNVPVMLAAVVHALALRAFYRLGQEHSCLMLSVQAANPERSMAVPDACAAVQQMADAHEGWSAQIPEDPAGLWDWCLAQPQDVLLALLAHIGALSIDAIRQKSDRPEQKRFGHADALAETIGFDIADHYTPDVLTYFSRVSSAQIVSALCEAKGVPAAPAWNRMKKAELAVIAAREIAGTRWLPEVLRTPVVDAVNEAA